MEETFISPPWSLTIRWAAVSPKPDPWGLEVKKGDLAADIPDGKLGARVHCSINGTVASVKADHIIIEKDRAI